MTSQLPQPDPRVAQLVRERERLLREVGKKKRLLERASARANEEARASVTAMAPLVERHASLVRDLSQLFAELLAPGRLTPRAARQVEKVRRALELRGYLGPSELEPAATDDEVPTDEGEPSRDRSRATEDRVGHSRETVGSAPQPAANRRSLRELFRSLAHAVHPDRARTQADQVRRTELMKEVARAYESGDLARLLELERTWQAETAAPPSEPEQRCRELERQNRELLDQVRSLTEQIKDVKRRAREVLRGPLERVLARAARELDDFAAVCEHVRRFRDGKSSLADFLNGPFGST